MDATSEDPIGRLSSRPDFAVLIYPVISTGELGHRDSCTNLLGPNPTPESLTFFSSEKQVTDQTPPTFLAHAKDDKTVSPENSSLFADALKAHHIPNEYLELPSGGHGLNGYSLNITPTRIPASPSEDTLGPSVAETTPKSATSSINSPAPAPVSPTESSSPAPPSSSSTSAKTESLKRKP